MDTNKMTRAEQLIAIMVAELIKEFNRWATDGAPISMSRQKLIMYQIQIPSKSDKFIH